MKTQLKPDQKSGWAALHASLMPYQLSSQQAEHTCKS